MYTYTHMPTTGLLKKRKPISLKAMGMAAVSVGGAASFAVPVEAEATWHPQSGLHMHSMHT